MIIVIIVLFLRVVFGFSKSISDSLLLFRVWLTVPFVDLGGLSCFSVNSLTAALWLLAFWFWVEKWFGLCFFRVLPSCWGEFCLCRLQVSLPHPVWVSGFVFCLGGQELLIFFSLSSLSQPLPLDLLFCGISIYSKAYVFYLSNISKRYVPGDVDNCNFRNLWL